VILRTTGHPILHQLTRTIPSSQWWSATSTRHFYAFQYLGYMWWDNETDGGVMYPRSKEHSAADAGAVAKRRNPEAESLRGNWSDPDFLRELTGLNPKLKQTQFGDFHSHGWVYRAVSSTPRVGCSMARQASRGCENRPNCVCLSLGFSQSAHAGNRDRTSSQRRMRLPIPR